MNMPTTLQLQKAFGNLPDVKLEDVGRDDLAVVFGPDVPDVDERPCGCPDQYDSEIASADPDELSQWLDLTPSQCKNLIEAHQRMSEEATGRGSYPPNCNPDYTGLHAVAYYDDPTDWPSHLKRPLTDKEFQEIIDAKVWGPSGDHNGTPFTMEELKRVWGGKPMNEVVNDFSEETYRRFGVILYPVFTGPNGQHNIHVKYPVIPGSTIGIGWFPGADPCPGDHVNLHIDKTYTAGFQGQFGLKIHELGHTLQLQHQFSGQGSHQEPMSYSYSRHLVVGYSTGDPVFGLPRSPSIRRLTEMYGGEPVGVPWKGKFLDTPTTPPANNEYFPTEPLEFGVDKQGRPIILNEFERRGRRFYVRPLPFN